jgi:O-glycosyl hydrolase
MQSHVTRAAIGLMAVLSMAHPAICAGETVQVDVKTGQRQQVMDGFGASHLLLDSAGSGVDSLGPYRNAVIQKVYGDIGINTGNLDIGVVETTGGWSGIQNDDDDPFHIHPPGFDWSGSAFAKTRIIDLAKPLGFTDYYLTGKISTRWRDQWLASYRTADYPRYLNEAAEQVVAIALHWRDTYGDVPKYYMLFNEPLSGNRELSGATSQNVVDLVKVSGARLRQAGFADMKFVLPAEETEQKSLDLAKAILDDPVARGYVGVLAYHPYPYGSDYAGVARILSTSGKGTPVAAKLAVRDRLRELAAQHQLPLWMTEVSNGSSNPASYDTFRARAIHIHDELKYANASAYFGMNNYWDKTVSANGKLLVQANEGNLVLLDNDTGAITITGMGYAIGHYARWIEPGAVRLDAASGDSLVQISAFDDAAAGRLAMVLINNAAESRQIQVRLTDLEYAGELAFVGEQSTPDGGYWQPIAGFTGTRDRIMLTLPPLSVTSIAASIPEPSAGAAVLPSLALLVRWGKRR